jgi:hypothetical protein
VRQAAAALASSVGQDDAPPPAPAAAVVAVELDRVEEHLAAGRLEAAAALLRNAQATLQRTAEDRRDPAEVARYERLRAALLAATAAGTPGAGREKDKAVPGGKAKPSAKPEKPAAKAERGAAPAAPGKQVVRPTRAPRG